MEALINYKLSDFLKLTSEETIQDYLVVLDLLNPLNEIPNPTYKWFNKQPKTLNIKSIKDLSFGDVSIIRNNFNNASIETIFDSIKMILNVQDKEILNFTILTFYGIINNIKNELVEITNMEINELTDDSFDENDSNLLAVNANERMSRFGVLNIIDSLAKEDILKWELIEQLPYMTVFTKLMIDKTKSTIHKDISELQRKKQQQQNV